MHDPYGGQEVIWGDWTDDAESPAGPSATLLSPSPAEPTMPHHASSARDSDVSLTCPLRGSLRTSQVPLLRSPASPASRQGPASPRLSAVPSSPPRDQHDDVSDTFILMRWRALRRQQAGTYGQHGTLRWVFMFAALGLLFGSTVPTYQGGRIQWGSKNHEGMSEGIPLVVITFGCSLFFLYLIGRVALLVLWSMYWVVLTILLKFITTGSLLVFGENTPTWIYVFFGITEGLTFLYAFVRYFYPGFVKRRWIPHGWWRLKRIRPESAPLRRENMAAFFSRGPAYCCSYRASAMTFLRRALLCRKTKNHVCAYRGGLDQYGRPHGVGSWVDSQYHGECLEGWWCHGHPRAPFRSREYGSGYCFESVLVGWVDCAAQPFKTSYWIPRPGPLKVGLASVECSVSGKFYTDMPRV
eukprot:Hpha_TRINITY_DN31096_c0_g1::TRINITY_DN31096_c0_g1_i1::g.64018::m.64018